jgi:hypothetical protein
MSAARAGAHANAANANADIHFNMIFAFPLTVAEG